MKKCICIDIDGTLCELRESLKPYGNTEEEVLRGEIYDEIKKNYSPLDFTIIILTGRKYLYHDITVKWLDENKIRYDYLIMCKDGKPEENHIFKKRTLRVLQQMYDVKMVYDDNVNVGIVCNKLGIPFRNCYF